MRLPLAMALLLAGCGHMQTIAPVTDVDPECRRSQVKSVDPLDTGVRWAGDPEDPAAWDTLGRDVIRQLVDKLGATERSRIACVGYIDDLHKRGVIRKK